VATQTNQSIQAKRQTKDCQPTPRGFSNVRQNGDSTGDGTVSDNIGLSFVYLMCLKFLHFCLVLFLFYPCIFRIVSCITCIYFLKHTQASKLGGELAICPMTIGQGSDA
jgi:hypothetical protein